MVQTVLRLGSKRTTLPSMLLVLVLYMGFSNVAWPLLFSCAEQPENSALSVLLKAHSETRLQIREEFDIREKTHTFLQIPLERRKKKKLKRQR